MRREQATRRERAAILELKDGRYFIGLWCVPGRTVNLHNWVAAVFRDGDTQRWEARYRFRYKDGTMRSGGATKACAEAEAYKSTNGVAADFARIMNSWVDYLDLRTDDTGKILQALAVEPWASRISGFIKSRE